jgi:N-acetylmuramoyl-L-alanine amidase
MKAIIFRVRKPIIVVLSAIAFFSFSVSNQWLEQNKATKSNSSIAFTQTSPNLTASSQAAFAQQQPVKASLVAATTYQTTKAFAQYQPKYTVAAIDSSNYGDRYKTDIHGKTLDNQPIAVLHETVGSAMSAINTFRTSHDNNNQQSSYHALITLNGTIVYLVPADKRAFGAGNSVFKSSRGMEAVQTSPNLPPSVNNFAYHISLETPADGRKSSNSSHSGYTDSQYKSLAWLLALSSIPDERITTHRKVDLTGNRFDPRSFSFEQFFSILHTYRQPTLSKVSTN